MSQIIYGNQVNDTDVSATLTSGIVTSYTNIDRILNRSISDSWDINTLAAFNVTLTNIRTNDIFDDFNAICLCGLKYISNFTMVFKDEFAVVVPHTVKKTTEKNRVYKDVFGFGKQEDKDVYILLDSEVTGVSTIDIQFTAPAKSGSIGSWIVGSYKDIDFSLKGVNLSSVSTSQKKYSDGRQLYYTSNPLVLKATFNSVALPSLDVWGTSIDSLSNINYSHDTTGLLIFIMAEIDNICLYGTQSQGMKFKVIEGNDSTGEKMWQASFSIEEEL